MKAFARCAAQRRP